MGTRSSKEFFKLKNNGESALIIIRQIQELNKENRREVSTIYPGGEIQFESQKAYFSDSIDIYSFDSLEDDSHLVKIKDIRGIGTFRVV